MTENELAALIVDRCYQIHKALGPGLFESVYEEILGYELTEAGLYFTRQTLIPVYYKNLILKLGFRADLIVEEKVIIEIKSIEAITSVHKKQLLTYLRLTGLKLGLLVNFNESLIKDGITRLVNNL
jgi:GxxExxY protein